MGIRHSVSDYFLGPCLRSIPAIGQEIYLTFDDGPDVETTPAILDLLAKHGVKATFFLVAENAQTFKPLARRIWQDGHGIGNHSLNHAYRPFFRSRRTLMQWVRDSSEILADLLGVAPSGFRPPAGVRTPQLGSVVQELNEPLILWSHRYYDAVWTWTKKAARSKMHNLSAGHIVLLHDRQRPTHRDIFLRTLDWYLESVRGMGFSFQPLERELCVNAALTLRGKPIIFPFTE